MANARGDHSTIEVDDLAIELKKTMRTTNLTMSPQRCIFKVPNILQRHNPKAYAPNAFSIGPYHYGEEHLQATQKIKLKYLQDLIYGSDFEDPDTLLRTLIGAISDVQQKARDCYGDPIDHISADEFVKILVLDGCFLIELFRRNKYEYLKKDDDPVFTVSWMSELLCHDLILLENQIPWMVLGLLFDIISRKLRCSCESLSSLVLDYFNRIDSFFAKIDDPVVESFTSREHESNKHILDMLRNLSSTKPREQCLQINDLSQWKTMPSATRLTEAGIKFKRGTSSKSIFLKLSFFTTTILVRLDTTLSFFLTS